MNPYLPHGPAVANDPMYLDALVREAAFWANPSTICIADANAMAPLGPIKRHQNRRLTGSEDRYWYEVIREHGPYKRGLVLGSGSTVEETAILEQNPGVHLTFCDIDEAGLSTRQALFEERFPGRATVERMDLNFVEFEACSYDLIISADTLHHVVNLEHIAHQINRALTEDGWFFLHDFTGASGFRFPAAQKRIFEIVYERERSRRPDAGLPAADWKDVDNYDTSPFEAVRSSEIIDVLRRDLREVHVRQVGSIFGLPMFCDILRDFTAPPRESRFRRSRFLRRKIAVPAGPPPIAWERLLSEECFRELALIDDLVVDAGIFPAMNSFAVYRKKC